MCAWPTKASASARPVLGQLPVVPAIISACEITGAQAIHPGYGFLSENAAFAQVLEDHGITFIGPTAEHIRIMGDKITAKDTMKKLGVPCVPGSDGGVPDCGRGEEGGRGDRLSGHHQGHGRRRRARHEGRERRERAGDRLPHRPRPRPKPPSAMTKSIWRNTSRRPRHIEIQVFGDGKGSAVHLGERDCSLQRRHQKVFEEAPGPVITPKPRAEIGKICADAVAAINYIGAGTIEFLYEDGEFYFIEMNTRLQVEHPVTEAIFGVDLVREQIRVAAGLPMSFTQDDLMSTAMPSRSGSTPKRSRTSRPRPGKITQFHAPGGLGVRMDSARSMTATASRPTTTA